MSKYIIALYVWLQIDLGRMILPKYLPPQPTDKIKFSCGWIDDFFDTIPAFKWINNALGFSIVLAVAIALVGIAVLVIIAKLKVGHKVSEYVGAVVFWAFVLYALVMIILPRVNFPCNPFT